MKKITTIVMSGLIGIGGLIGMVGCGGGSDVVNLKVWGPSAQQETLAEMAEEFKAANPGTKYNITVGVCSEGDAYINVSKDPSAAADVYAYSNDQIVNLIRCGGIAQIGGSYAESVRSTNSADSVEAASFDGKLYGYPYASDNGYFLFYDKSVITEEQVQTLEGIIAASEGANKKIGWPLDEPWYTAGWFFTFGCSYSVEYNADYSEKSVECDFNSAGGIKASKAMAKLTGSKSFAGKGTNNDTIVSKFGTGEMSAAVSGTWNADAIKEKLGENYGVSKLPTVTVDGETEQMRSFKGFKLYGVNPHSQAPAEAHRLAAFLSGEKMQERRFEKHGVGPTNTTVAAQDSVKSNPAFAAVKAQNEYGVPQSSVPSNFWNPLKAYGGYIIDGLVEESSYQDFLNTMVAQIKTSL